MDPSTGPASVAGSAEETLGSCGSGSENAGSRNDSWSLRMTKSTRRFFWRCSGVSFGATGWYSPYPAT
ncbi:MAG: hypothetical protein FJY97_21480 [candidate division Zixibacteria bacterium]|nr:hypothetical protein [candidate division Zixibacteria bacterium]